MYLPIAEKRHYGDCADNGTEDSMKVQTQTDPELSVIVPLLDEEENLEALHDALSEALGPLPLSYRCA